MPQLKNVSRRMQVYVLDSEELRESHGEHKYKRIVVPTVIQDARSGKLGIVRQTKSVCSSVSFVAGETQDISDAALQCASIQSAILKGDLRLVTQN